MENSKMGPQTSLFQVYLRLRPPIQNQISKQADPWLLVDAPTTPTEQTDEKKWSSSHSTHVTLQPPNDSRKRAVERFGFTKIFQENATQLDVFEETGTAESIKNLLSSGRDGLIATLGVTGSGKSHTILGSKSQRGLTQMTLDVIFKSIGPHIRRSDDPDLSTSVGLVASLQACDPSEAQVQSAISFLESVYSEGDRARLSRAQTPLHGGSSRAQTPMMVRDPLYELPGRFPTSPQRERTSQVLYPKYPIDDRVSNMSMLPGRDTDIGPFPCTPPITRDLIPIKKSPPKLSFWNRIASPARKHAKYQRSKDSIIVGQPTKRQIPLPYPSTLPQSPDVTSYATTINPNADYVVLVSMYEVYNDRIFDLLSSMQNTQHATTRQGSVLQRGLLRRPLLFKNTEMSPDRKVVAGLRKILCSSYEEALVVLETGLTERRVAGTGSNSVSSRSHGFFCVEVKQTPSTRGDGPAGGASWTGGALSIVDLAGSERARNAKTTGSTLAEAGKINESLMYLGQCLQVQSDCQHDGSKPIVPFRQCKLTELLFTNSFPSSNQQMNHRPQKAVMIVTADPQGDFNATSQILRYSALAREVTVPRIPSITSTIMGGCQVQSKVQGGPPLAHEELYSSEELEHLQHEVSKLSDECNNLAMRLAEEEIKRCEAELKLAAANDKVASVEAHVREECWSEMEEQMQQEKQRWRAAWERQQVRKEEYLDGKIGILERSQNTEEFVIHQDDLAVRMEEIQRANEALLEKVRKSEQEVQSKSPSKKRTITKKPATERNTLGNTNVDVNTNPFLASLRTKLPNDVSILELTRHLETARVNDSSPAKLRLRTSSTDQKVFDGGDKENSREDFRRSTRKQTARIRDFGDVEETSPGF